MSNVVLDWLPSVLRKEGLKVAEVGNWLERSRPGPFGPVKGIICHHTAGPKNDKNMPSLDLVKNGRPDLQGPLAQLCLGRDGTFYVLSAGRCNHAGKGAWRGITAGNTHFIGIEAENAGARDDPWPEVQMDAYRRGVAAILRELKLDSDMCIGHKEFAPGRKIDPRFDMDQFRSAVDDILRGVHPPPKTVPVAESQEDVDDGASPRQTLQRMAVGELVKQVQEKLELKPTGQFDAKTEAAVRQLQREHGLVPDGIVGPMTWQALDGKRGKLVVSDLPALSSKELRELWKEYECAEEKMELIPFGPDKIRVAPPTAPAWDALATVLLYHDYRIRTQDTDSYNCRNVKGGSEKSLHAYGIALDVNWTTNPYKDHAGKRPTLYSNRETQDARAQDVRLGKADTDMTRQMIEKVLAIKTQNGKRLFEWGGSWLTLKDAMHFQLNVGPDDLKTGIKTATFAGSGQQPEEEGDDDILVAEVDTPTEDPGQKHWVTAESGLKLRSEPSTGSTPIRTIPKGGMVYVTGSSGSWLHVSLDPDAKGDGWMFAKHLSGDEPVSGTAGSPSASGDGGILGQVTPEQVAKMFPQTKRANIESNLPHVLKGLEHFGLTDRKMLLMALATIRAETESFRPIDEGQSKFNTRSTPFDRYEFNTEKGKELGNVKMGDGARFKGRGYIQLTGRHNYAEIGRMVGQPLADRPELANDPVVAGLILACFLKRREKGIREDLAKGDLKRARRKVNGGVHGFDRFESAYQIGISVLP